MSLDYIRTTYGVPAKSGARVVYTGNGVEECGTITGAKGAHLLIRLDDETHIGRFHPTWELRYLVDGVVATKDAIRALSGPKGQWSGDLTRGGGDE